MYANLILPNIIRICTLSIVNYPLSIAFYSSRSIFLSRLSMLAIKIMMPKKMVIITAMTTFIFPLLRITSPMPLAKTEVKAKKNRVKKLIIRFIIL